MMRLTKCCARVHGIMEDDDVTAANGPVWQEGLPVAAGAEAGLVHQQVVADQQSVFHRAGWNPKSLHDKGDDEQRDDQRQQAKAEGAP